MDDSKALETEETQSPCVEKALESQEAQSSSSVIKTPQDASGCFSLAEARDSRWDMMGGMGDEDCFWNVHENTHGDELDNLMDYKEVIKLVVGDDNMGDYCKEEVSTGDGVGNVADICGAEKKDILNAADVTKKNIQDDGLDFVSDDDKEVASKIVDSNVVDNFSIFSPGDVVWVKTKKRTWWPGKIICDDTDLPTYDATTDQPGRLCVAYFGLNAATSCNSSELKPFYVDFEHLSMQNKSMNFRGAVEKAVYQFGKRVKEDMMCPCLVKGEGTSPPKRMSGGLGKFGADKFVPCNLLGHVRNLAMGVSTAGVLELSALKNMLSAFYLSSRHGQLPIHQLLDNPNSGEKDFQSGSLMPLREGRDVDLSASTDREGNNLMKSPIADSKCHVPEDKKRGNARETMERKKGKYMP